MGGGVFSNIGLEDIFSVDGQTECDSKISLALVQTVCKGY